MDTRGAEHGVGVEKLTSAAQRHVIVIVAYLVAHAATSLLVYPVQSHFLEDVSVFASLVYLPHGVRVLATWLYGWKAITPLILGAIASEMLLTPGRDLSVYQPVLVPSVLVGAVSAFCAFEFLRATGRNFYACAQRHIGWKNLILAGAVASVFNSLGQSAVFSGLILPDAAATTFAIYMIGDIAGLVVTMVVLMFAFRWLRIAGDRAK